MAAPWQPRHVISFNLLARFLQVALPLGLAASCSGGEQQVANEGAMPIPCALASGSGWGEDCRLEIASVGGQQVLILRHPDGSFRRLRREAGLVAVLDGMHDAATEMQEGRQIVTVDGDRYAVPLGDLPDD